MKPHIRYFRGLYYCRVPGRDTFTPGIGCTPTEAYNDWLAMRMAYARAVCA